MDYEAPGNLAQTNAVSCGPLVAMRSTYTPVDLYGGVLDCISTERFDDAADLYALAAAYGTFDTLRVEDKSAHQAVLVLQMNAFQGLGEAAKQGLQGAVAEVAQDPSRMKDLCARVRGVGAPTYHPTYMIQHGMGAFLEEAKGDGLLAPFDPTAAWQVVLTSHLHCPKP